MAELSNRLDLRLDWYHLHVLFS